MQAWKEFLHNLGGTAKLNFGWSRQSGKKWTQSLTLTNRQRNTLRMLMHGGVPNEYRADVWYRLSGGSELKARSPNSYQQLYQSQLDSRIRSQIDQVCVCCALDNGRTWSELSPRILSSRNASWERRKRARLVRKKRPTWLRFDGFYWRARWCAKTSRTAKEWICWLPFCWSWFSMRKRRSGRLLAFCSIRFRSIISTKRWAERGLTQFFFLRLCEL